MENEEHKGLHLKTGKENTNEIFRNGVNPKEVLERETTFRIRDCTISNIAQVLWYNFTTDINGIVATFKNFSDVLAPFSYLGILPRERQSLIKVYDILRKHLQLSNYSGKGIECLRWSVSVKCFDADGFDFHLALLPKPGRERFSYCNSYLLENTQYDFYECFRKTLSKCAQSLSSKELSRGTFKKNNILNMRKWRVLPDDRRFVLHLLDQALNETPHGEEFEAVIVAFKMGEHDTSPEIKISAFDANAGIVSVHAAITISSEFLDQHMFWSRFGLQEIVGERGTFLSALSFSSCANFQTNLDGRIIDISPDLLGICEYPHHLNFLQFYADTPHLCKSYIHPVFGSIVSSGILHENILRSLENSSEEYLSVCKENYIKLSRVNARVEIVCIKRNSTNILRASDFISVSSLQDIISRYPVIVPFANRTCQYVGLTFSRFIRSIPEYIYQTLTALYNDNKRKGGFFPVWKAYQYETANETFWRGKPNSCVDHSFAINLGTGAVHPSRSLTWEKGFLCLENSHICALNEQSTPPMNFVRLSKTDEERIKRIFNFSDVLNAGNIVIGKRSALILIQDLIADPQRTADCDRSLLASLRGNSVPSWGKLSGSVTVTELCEKLCKKEHFKYPYVFGRVLQMIEESGRNSYEVLQTGLRQLRLSFFPELRYYDSCNHKKVIWNGAGVLKVVDGKQCLISKERSAEVTQLVIQRLESDQLVYKSKFQDLLQSEMFCLPWIPYILENLCDVNIDHNLLMELCQHLSCIGLIQNRWYVCYPNFQKLHLRVHSKCKNLTTMLQNHQILSRFSVQLFPHLSVMQLHECVPHFIEEPDLKGGNKKGEDVDNDLGSETEESVQTNTIVDELDNDLNVANLEIENVFKVPRRHCTAGYHGRWGAVELELLHNVKESKPKSLKSAYEMFLTLCDERALKDRTFWSFKHKFARTFN